jgi:hypothetical protein
MTSVTYTNLFHLGGTPVNVRIDLLIIEAYRKAGNQPHFRQLFLSRWRENPEIMALALSSVSGRSGITPREEEIAMATIADYYLEPYFLPTMSVFQADAYFASLERTMTFNCSDAVFEETEGSLLIETMHHQASFSALYILCKQLNSAGRFDKIVLLRRRQDFDVRLEVMQTLGRRVFGVESELISVSSEDWPTALRRAAAKRTIILYFGDLAPSLFPSHHQGRKTSSVLRLCAGSDPAMTLEGFSIGARLARLLRARHYLMDFPDPDLVRVQPRDDRTELQCSLAQWVFWPALNLFTNGNARPSDSAITDLETA